MSESGYDRVTEIRSDASTQATGVAERFGAQIGPLQDQPWRMRDFALTDPSGVLWRIGHNLPLQG